MLSQWLPSTGNTSTFPPSHDEVITKNDSKKVKAGYGSISAKQTNYWINKYFQFKLYSPPFSDVQNSQFWKKKRTRLAWTRMMTTENSEEEERQLMIWRIQHHLSNIADAMLWPTSKVTNTVVYYFLRKWCITLITFSPCDHLPKPKKIYISELLVQQNRGPAGWKMSKCITIHVWLNFLSLFSLCCLYPCK